MQLSKQLGDGVSSGIEVILVDFFDTLVTRTVYPEYVKRIWAKRLGAVYGLGSESRGIYETRAKLESQLCRSNFSLGHDLEFQYKQLIEALGQVWSFMVPGSPEPSKELCENLEHQVEMDVQKVRTDVVDFLKSARAGGCRVVCVSDFYMEGRFLRGLLDAHGIGGVIDEVFTSGEVLLTKASGRLYDTVLERLGLSSSRCLMVGDNPVSDGAMAKSRGIHTRRVSRQGLDQYYQKHRTVVENPEVFARRLFSQPHPLFPFSGLAASLYLFVERLHRELVRNEARTVYFFAREGQFLKKLFDDFQARQGTSIRTHYFLASRKATFLPSLGPLGEEQFETLFRQYRKIPVVSFLLSLGFSRQEADDLCQTVGVDADRVEDDLPTSRSFELLVSHPAFRNSYEQRRTEQRQSLRAYAGQQGWSAGSTVHLVDVGWKGTMQEQLARVFPDITFSGHYLGLHRAPIEVDPQKTGLLFTTDQPLAPSFEVYNLNRALFEVALGADHPGTAGYRLAPDGTAQAILDEIDPTAGLYSARIQALQKSLFQEFCRFASALQLSHHVMEDFQRLVVGRHHKMLILPTRSEVRLFMALSHAENFGVFEVTRFSTGSRGLRQWLRGAASLLRNPQAWLQAGFWYPATFHDRGFGFLVPVIGWRRLLKSRQRNNI